MSPALWSGGIQGIPDKNDILDIMMHVRRAGPNTTDSLWMFGGISLGTTGNRILTLKCTRQILIMTGFREMVWLWSRCRSYKLEI